MSSLMAKKSFVKYQKLLGSIFTNIEIFPDKLYPLFWCSLNIFWKYSWSQHRVNIVNLFLPILRNYICQLLRANDSENNQNISGYVVVSTIQRKHRTNRLRSSITHSFVCFKFLPLILFTFNCFEMLTFQFCNFSFTQITWNSHSLRCN